jgi:hypothetical protein
MDHEREEEERKHKERKKEKRKNMRRAYLGRTINGSWKRKILPLMIAGLGSCLRDITVRDMCIHEMRKQKRKNGIKEAHKT